MARKLLAAAVVCCALIVSSALPADFPRSPASAVAAEPKTEITYWTFLPYGGTRPREKAETEIIDNFKKKYSDIDVKVEIIPWDELHKKFLATVGTGGGPDVVRVDPTHLLLHVKANSLAPLDPYIATWPDSERNDFFSWPGSVVNGQKMAINIAENAFTLIYRKDLFEQKGLKPPKSWDEFVQACKALTTPQQWGFGFAAARAGSYFHVIFAPLIWGAGGEILDREGRAVFNDAAGAKAVKLLHDLVHVHKCVPPEVLNTRHEDEMQGFMAGKYAMVIEGANRYATIERSKTVKGKLGIAPIPSLSGAKPAPAYRTGGWNLAINRTSNHKDAGWRFINHYVSRESQIVNARVGGDFPARRSIFLEPFMKQPENGHLVQFAEIMNTASRGPLLSDRFEELVDGVVLAVHKVLLNEATPERALDEVAKRFNETK